MAFVLHNYVAKWQDNVFQFCLVNLPLDVVMSAIGFAENYTFVPQNEIQSMHWATSQISILMHLCWWRVPVIDEQELQVTLV